ncbi:MAG: Photosystem I assembly protein Ycf3 [Candidatus Heimdallarchaeota archaeon LC_3]|nr:MAG: Photosystem I assembly protein Ycf3 [Candidatus Heimdallarchaeota archaeon LC_3]
MIEFGDYGQATKYLSLLSKVNNSFLFTKKELLSSRILIIKGQLDKAYSILNNIKKTTNISLDSDLYIETRLRFCEVLWRQKKLSDAKKILDNIQIQNISSDIVKSCYYDNLLALLWIEGKNYEALGYLNSLTTTTNPAYSGLLHSKFGLIYRATGNLEKALEHHYKSLECFEEVKNKTKIAGTLNNIALIEIDLAQFAKASENLERALQIFTEIGNTDHIIFVLNNLGSIQGHKDDYTKAIEYYQKALKLTESAQDPVSIALVKGYLGFAYRSLGNLDLALKSYNESLTIYKNMNNDNFIANQLFYIGEIYSTIGHLQIALDYLFQSLEIHKKIGAGAYFITVTLLEISNIYTEQGLYDSALAMVDNTSLYSNKDNPHINYLINKIFGSIYLQMGKIDDAYEYHEKTLHFAIQTQSPSNLGFASLELAIDYLTSGKEIKSSDIINKFPHPPFDSVILDSVLLLVRTLILIQENKMKKVEKNLEIVIQTEGLDLKYKTYAFELLTEIHLIFWKKQQTIDNYQQLKRVIGQWEEYSITRKLLKNRYLINVIKAKFLISELQFAEANKLLQQTLHIINPLGYNLLKDKILKELNAIKEFSQTFIRSDENQRFQEIQIDEIKNYLENIKILDSSMKFDS